MQSPLLTLSAFVAVVIILLLLIGADAAAATTSSSSKKPNIVFLICESTDGRAWQKGYQDNVIPLPNIRSLEEAAGGYSFYRNYAASPVCCPSRSALWSGRHVHKLPHIQCQSHTNSRTNRTRTLKMPVDGVFNNFEGLPRDFDQRIDQVLEKQAGYEIYLSGKTDWDSGSHVPDTPIVWTKYSQIPYNVYKSGGWSYERDGFCSSNGTVTPGNASAHKKDWKTLNQTVQWMHDHAKNESTKDKPFFVYQGFDIVHPPYVTNQYYYNQIDPSKIEVPPWPLLNDLHPCDFQSSMLKGCIPPLNNATARDYYYSHERRRNIRRIYYAMIAEFDAMVGAYIKAIQDIGAWDNTVFIVTSDHGDMQMEHQQFYKMVPYDASSSVPLVIYDGRKHHQEKWQQGELTNRVIQRPTQLIDLYPTIMDLVGVDPADYPKDQLDGHSLVPLMTASSGDLNTEDFNASESSGRPDFIVSQHHGMNLAMSWFMVVRPMPCIEGTKNTCTMKLVVWGTGNEEDSQLFDLTRDPHEMINLIRRDPYATIISRLEQDLRSVVNYPQVSLDVARYNKESMKHFIEVMGEPDWRNAIQDSVRWGPSWAQDSAGSFQALEEWLLNETTEISPCRHELVWPPEVARLQ